MLCAQKPQSAEAAKCGTYVDSTGMQISIKVRKHFRPVLDDDETYIEGPGTRRGYVPYPQDYIAESTPADSPLQECPILKWLRRSGL